MLCLGDIGSLHFQFLALSCVMLLGAEHSLVRDREESWFERNLIDLGTSRFIIGLDVRLVL